MAPRFDTVSFLSDYGLQDEFVGVCHAVIAGIAPDARVIDLTHGIPRHDVVAGAHVLATSLPYAPVGVHLAVVDPEVGGSRRAVALELADGRRLVGPDNGLLMVAAAAGGGVVQAVDISHSPLRLEPVSATFHGRDIFAPIAAHLSIGIALGDAGRPCDPAELVELESPVARVDGAQGVLVAPVMLADRFGNLQTAATHDDLEALGLQLGHEVLLRLPSGQAHTARYVRRFAEVPKGELIVYEDAARRLAIAVGLGDAAARLGLGSGDEITVSRGIPRPA